MMALLILAAASAFTGESLAESPTDKKIGWIKREVAEGIAEFRRTGTSEVLEKRCLDAITSGIVDNAFWPSNAARVCLLECAVELWIEADGAQPYRLRRGEPGYDQEVEQYTREHFMRLPPSTVTNIWAWFDAQKAEERDWVRRYGYLQRTCGLLVSELRCLYDRLYGPLEDGAHIPEFVSEFEVRWKKRPRFSLFATNLVKEINMVRAEIRNDPDLRHLIRRKNDGRRFEPPRAAEPSSAGAPEGR